MTVTREMYDQFAERGYLGPVRVLSAQECARFLKGAFGPCERPPLDWDKGHAASSRAFYEIGTHPAIIEVVAGLLGEDVMLWGASVQNRPPGVIHAWHSDIETSAPLGKTLSAWIGIEHTNRDSSLAIIPYSHRLGVTIQELRHQYGKGRDETTSDDIVRWARERDKRSHFLRLELTDGEAVFFDGKLWHFSHNLSSKPRSALLLQYATPDTAVRIPDFNHLDWPFHQLNVPRPPCLMVRGSDEARLNRIVPPPAATSASRERRLTSRVYPLQIPLPSGVEKGWKPHPIFNGWTADIRSLSCHVSVLTQDQCPHPPHTHNEEELLLLLDGEVDLILPD